MREPGQQRVHRKPGHRIDPLRRNLDKRREHEAPLAETWMRDYEPRLVDDGLAVQDQIQIERARRACVGTFTAECALNREKRLEQVARRKRAFPCCCCVQEPRLGTDADGCRVVKSRETKAGDVLAQVSRGLVQVPLAVPQVAPEGERHANHYSSQRVGSTLP